MSLTSVVTPPPWPPFECFWEFCLLMAFGMRITTGNFISCLHPSFLDDNCVCVPCRLCQSLESRVQIRFVIWSSSFRSLSFPILSQSSMRRLYAVSGLMQRKVTFVIETAVPCGLISMSTVASSGGAPG